MSNETITGLTEQFTKAFEPTRAFVGLTVDHIEKLAQVQIEAAKAYTDLGIAQTREALQISDAKSLQDYVARQKDVAETVTKRVSDDAQKLGELGTSYTEEATKLVEQNIGQVQGAAKPASRQAATKSSGAKASA
ncbi:phasin family protein [Arhodomonas sp. AD133]|uniref:phasin family protein n=1 Tax=Arhodomonas sp. AD133 TaxID=3415009 RepID=UPI003EBFE56E